MLQGFKNIKFYILGLLLAFGFYSWASFSGTRIFGDDNENKDGHAINSSGSGHAGGHGFYYHK